MTHPITMRVRSLMFAWLMPENSVMRWISTTAYMRRNHLTVTEPSDVLFVTQRITEETQSSTEQNSNLCETLCALCVTLCSFFIRSAKSQNVIDFSNISAPRLTFTVVVSPFGEFAEGFHAWTSCPPLCSRRSGPLRRRPVAPLFAPACRHFTPSMRMPSPSNA